MTSASKAAVLVAVCLAGLVAFAFVLGGRVFGATAGVIVCTCGLLVGVAGLFPPAGDR